MKYIKPMVSVLVLVLAFFTTTAQAAFVFGNDIFKFTGDTYIDVSGADTQGIGRVSTITQGGNVIWSSGDAGEYLNFTFGGFSPVVAPVPPVFNYVATGGFVNFFTTNDASIFDTTLTPAAAIAAIATGNLFLSTVANGNTVGIGTPVTYSASGFLDVTGGAFGTQLDTNSRPTFLPGVFADLSFGLVGANNQNPLVNSGYAYISSADAQGASVPVPEPGILMLLGVGILMIAFQTKRSGSESFTVAA